MYYIINFFLIAFTLTLLFITAIKIGSINLSERDEYMLTTYSARYYPFILILSIALSLYISPTDYKEHVYLETASGEPGKVHITGSYRAFKPERELANCLNFNAFLIEAEKSTNKISKSKNKNEMSKRSFELNLLDELRSIGRNYCLNITEVSIEF